MSNSFPPSPVVMAPSFNYYINMRTPYAHIHPDAYMRMRTHIHKHACTHIYTNTHAHIIINKLVTLTSMTSILFVAERTSVHAVQMD